jgi:iron complex transport system substrate-binding protein
MDKPSVNSLYWRLTASCLMIFAINLGCSNGRQTKRVSNPELHYATGFSFVKQKGYVEISIFQSNQEELVFYASRRDSVLWTPKDRPVIEIPVKNLICTATTHLPWLEYLNVTDKLIGFPNMDLIYSEKIRQLKLVDISGPDGISIEKVASLKPSIIIANAGNEKLQEKLSQFDIPVIFTSEFSEVHPLGRAEWIKLMGILTDQYDLTDSVFNQIESEYKQALLDAKESSRPSVITGVPYGQVWFMPARNSYASTLFTDAGYRYLFDQESQDGILKPSIEVVYERALEADYWIGAGSFQTMDKLIQSDVRFSSFGPVLKDQVFVYDRMTSVGTSGNGYFELATLRPDLLLKDLIKIRDSRYDHEFVFYRKL